MNRDELQQLDKEFLIDMIISKEQMLIHYKGEYKKLLDNLIKSNYYGTTLSNNRHHKKRWMEKSNRIAKKFRMGIDKWFFFRDQYVI